MKIGLWLLHLLSLYRSWPDDNRVMALAFTFIVQVVGSEDLLVGADKSKWLTLHHGFTGVENLG